uniref:Putative tick til 31 n=1 Tax=Amblyomma americanum TaxID=6943 RepID=A0A0C9SEB5_AMBAM
MRCSVLALAVICVAIVSAKRTRKPVSCGLWEEAVRGKPTKDRFCKPHLTRPSLVKQLRRCVCKPGFVRNAWNGCILQRDCDRCKRHRHMDYNACESACPLTCGKPVATFCTAQCVSICACPPGYVAHPKRKNTCVAARKCPPKCPRHSRFQLCVSNCQHWCGMRRPRKCSTECHSGDCVCNRKYAKTMQNGQVVCVPKKKCPKPTQVTQKKQ